jgi:hypothetical protein
VAPVVDDLAAGVDQEIALAGAAGAVTAVADAEPAAADGATAAADAGSSDEPKA